MFAIAAASFVVLALWALWGWHRRLMPHLPPLSVLSPDGPGPGPCAFDCFGARTPLPRERWHNFNHGMMLVLFALVGADRAYFGQKDAQQVMVVRRMAIDLALPTDVIACPTVREADGLALSSRNVHLSAAEREAAPILHRALLAARSRWAAGERSAKTLRQVMSDELALEPLAKVEYTSVADGQTLRELARVDGAALLSLAVRFGSTRLIDNEPLP